MQLQLSSLLPAYFPESRKDNSEIWGKELLFKKGEQIKIVAPSGSGKTSLMHFLYGLRNDFTGSITYDEKNIQRLNKEHLAILRKDELSIVLQDMRLFPEQTVLENIEIKRQLNPYHSKEKITEYCEQLGIGSKVNQLCKSCSYGEQQRVAIIRAMMQPFSFLLLDEPFSHLDENNSKKAMQLMEEEAKARNASIIFADLERVDYFNYDRIFYL